MIDMAWPIFLIVCGLVLLVFGGELLVARRIVAGAIAQDLSLGGGINGCGIRDQRAELGVSLQAAYNGAADVAVGNVVGNNICNVLLILGMAALAAPLLVSSQLIRLDVPLMIVASLALWGFSLDLHLSTVEGIFLFAGLIAYVIYSVKKSRQESGAVIDEFTDEMPVLNHWTSSGWVQAGMIAIGLVMLGLGSNWLVQGAVTIAKICGVSELIIGLTVVAIGTWLLPEMVTSVVASIRGERDIAVGNVVGSNIFNILCVLGLSSIVMPGGVIPISPTLAFDIPVMVAVAVVCMPIFLCGVISRFQGALLLFYYVAYTSLYSFRQRPTQDVTSAVYIQSQRDRHSANCVSHCG